MKVIQLMGIVRKTKGILPKVHEISRIDLPLQIGRGQGRKGHCKRGQG